LGTNQNFVFASSSTLAYYFGLFGFHFYFSSGDNTYSPERISRAICGPCPLSFSLSLVVEPLFLIAPTAKAGRAASQAQAGPGHAAAHAFGG
jgi:hypothetical protein